MKKLLKYIITMLLASCIMISSILDGTVVANAAANPVIRSEILPFIKNSCTIERGDKEKLTAWSGKKEITENCIWKSSKKEVLSVSRKGLITAKKEGISYITAEYEGKTSKKLKVTVSEKYAQLENGNTILMKAGERKRFLVTDTNGKDVIPFMRWTTHDRNIVMIRSDFVNEKKDYTEYIEFIAIKPGTTTITGRDLQNDFINQFNGTDQSFDTDINVTVTVTELETATAEQEECRHSWKTVTKSTCEYAGMKECEKCGLQKKLKKSPHQFREVDTYGHEVIDVYFEVYCDNGCILDTTVKLSDYASADEIKNAHFYETNNGEGEITWHLGGVSDSIEREFEKAASEAIEKHSNVLGNWFLGGHDVLGEELVKTTAIECINCGAKKE